MAVREHAHPESAPRALGITANSKVGVVEAFTGQYTSARLLARFLELMGLQVISSRRTTPAIIDSGATLASADLCVPMRIYVGHVHHLLEEHPDMDFLVALNVLSEDGRCSTCAKYRDVGGVALRSLAGTVSYLAQRDSQFHDSVLALAGSEAAGSALARRRFPTLLMPNIRNLNLQEARNLCYNVYADIKGWSPARKALLFLPISMQRKWLPDLQQIDAAVQQAYTDVSVWRTERFDEMMHDVNRPRLVVAGRPYLVHDPALTCDLLNWFRRHGVCVITAKDVPPGQIRRDEVNGFYDSHREEEALVRWADDKADGIICIGSFGCHPDAFQLDHLAGVARQLGVACWTFRFDEAAGHTGFFTRFATILAFLEQRRNLRVNVEQKTTLPLRVAGSFTPRVAVTNAATPLITWPYMGEVLNAVIEEMAYQLGLTDYIVPPTPVTEHEMLLGNDRYTESCSPFACSTGSLRQTLVQIANMLEAEAQTEAQTVNPLPRRVIMLMLHGEGPCTFGWYSLVQRTHLPAEFADRFAALGHTVEMATAGMDGLANLARQLCKAGKASRLLPLLDCLEALGHQAAATHLSTPRWRLASTLRYLQRPFLQVYLLTSLRRLARPVFAKLDAVERLRARSLVLRAHEKETGAIAAAYQKGLQLLCNAHTVSLMRRAERKALRLLEAVPRDNERKPRIVAVGEIYVMLTSYANRGALEHLLGWEGLEVVEGIGLGKFIRHSLREMERRAICNTRPLRNILQALRKRNINLLTERLRDELAKPFLVHEVGGEGVPSVGAARRAVEAGCDGIVHLQPFKCMPEAISKDALKELAELFNIRYLALSFDREVEIERLRTEISTYATVLHAQVAVRNEKQGATTYDELRRRRRLGRSLDQAYRRYTRVRHTD